MTSQCDQTFEEKITPRVNIFAYFQSNGGYCVYYTSNILCNTLDLFKIGEYHSDISSFSWGIFSHMVHLDQSHESDNILMDYAQGYFHHSFVSQLS